MVGLPDELAGGAGPTAPLQWPRPVDYFRLNDPERCPDSAREDGRPG